MSEKIKVKNGYLDTISTEVNDLIVKTLIKKDFTPKVSYWLARVFDELPTIAKAYTAGRQKLIEKYALRYEEDGEEKEIGKDGKEKKGGKIIKSWKKGDIVSDGQSVSLTDTKAFSEELNELIEIENKLDINRIKFDFDKEPRCTIEEMRILVPLIDIEEQKV